MSRGNYTHPPCCNTFDKDKRNEEDQGDIAGHEGGDWQDCGATAGVAPEGSAAGATSTKDDTGTAPGF